ncbi:MAG: hypothetical protein ACTIA3_00735 [Corynebacterium casei]|uniref:Uncharacterized protein n=2 Tax=Corynebacterium casei TaxID=160386 RepID=G7HV89_9CORY|nr:hypothetical protein [Corynebacterium casei]AHI19739.1 hypothetical protein CCASEI_05815 [Corynebacterium casei LMG S-19264]MDN5826481.1 hypothetical protein [Corynebacterium casei]MDN5840126.1 hypothetical protein [Corynebacterium casei]MDN5883719.1 hypothetical protein [Corynebacterium casei]MDN5903087.1 hypothetical protein [Corynebacterium casei]
MPLIQFDVLVPHAQAKRVGEVFDEALNRLVTAERIDSAQVEINDTPRLQEGLEEQLRQTYRDEHEDHDLEDAEVYRYLIKLEGVKGSLNELGMVLGRLLTPHAVLPKDWVLLEDEEAHELPAIFPWTLAVSQ